MFQVPVLTTARVRLAYAVALVIDAIQLALGPFGWVLVDQVLDVAACILICRLLGFHPLLLPTFALELLPVADVLPLWTGAVAIVVALRRRAQTPSTPMPRGPIIDV